MEGEPSTSSTSAYSQVKAYISVPTNHPTRYYTGDTVSGIVVIHSESVLTTRSICVVLIGTEFAQHVQSHTSRTFFTRRVDLFGEVWPNRSKGTVLQLPPGKHTFPFTFQLADARPAAGCDRIVLPPTGGAMKWYDRRHNNRSVIAISYVVRSFIDLNQSPSLKILHSIEPSIFKPDTIVTPLWPLPMMGHTESYEFIKNGLRTGITHQDSKTFLTTSGSLSCSVLLDRSVTFTYDDVKHGVSADLQAQVHAGEPFCRPLRALVTVTNGSGIGVEAISVSLVQEGYVSNLNSLHICDVWETESWSFAHDKVNIPPATGGFVAVPYEHLFTMRIPDGLTPHIETYYSKLRWFVRVEVHVGSALAVNLKVKVPIHIISLGPEPLLRELLNEPCEPIALPGSSAPVQTILVGTKRTWDIHAGELAVFGVLPKQDRVCTCCNGHASTTSLNPTPVVYPTTKSENVAATPELEVLNPIPTEELLAKALRWVPDDEAEACLNCATSFGVFTRKHHCRLCGKVFCNNCAPITDIPAIFGSVPQRACLKCHVTQAPVVSVSAGGDYNPKNVPKI